MFSFDCHLVGLEAGDGPLGVFVKWFLERINLREGELYPERGHPHPVGWELCRMQKGGGSPLAQGLLRAASLLL